MERQWSWDRIPRDRLEEMAFDGSVDIGRMRGLDPSRVFFYTILAGFLAGALVATCGFLIGAAIS